MNTNGIIVKNTIFAVNESISFSTVFRQDNCQYILDYYSTWILFCVLHVCCRQFFKGNGLIIAPYNCSLLFNITFA